MSIEKKKNELLKLLPDVKINYIHGKMNGKQIENIMLDFVDKKIDVLISTTILESGIDIPNANTIIVENADKLGLAALYQIKGRVGRSPKQAYAYITYKKDKIISEVAEKRLKAIKEFTQLGSGFKIAMRDLEIRGAR
jgi:transcription-repair coupling factor (superfamily II helicase)